MTLKGALLRSNLDSEIIRFHHAQEQLESPSTPVITDYPIDPTLQTGESRLLGGAMSINTPTIHDR